ncbi:MAG: MBL fold metallo-hydrolase [Candidatus Meridianibacter frigidus]|nr:MAG: MBL fold metallo-hydrolase [Candidatus Eremiobacteraeota bacterium]
MVKSSRIATVRAPNPSAMTLQGTNSYLIDGGNGEGICIDPGPAIESHIRALASAAEGSKFRIRAILLTHGHPDHAPAAAALRERTAASVYAHHRSAVPHDLELDDGEGVQVGDRSIRALDAPGHTFDHLVFFEERERALFTGDVIVGEGTVVIAPPGGAMRPYQATLERLARTFDNASIIYGGHGPPVTDPAAKIREYIEHRRQRERELLDALSAGPRTIPELVARIYAQTQPLLWPAGARQILAYLIALENESRVRSTPVNRPMTTQEEAILDPDWASITGEGDAELASAELGASSCEPIRRYALIR